MIDRFKEADEALHNLMLIALQVRNSSVRAGVYETTIRRCLILAQEAEQLRRDVVKCADNNLIINQQLCETIKQLRKERDEWQLKYNALLRVFGTVSDELERKVNENGNGNA